MKRVIIFCFVFSITSAQTAKCPECDPNDYNPVCASGKAFKSSCHLVRQSCLGKVVLTSNVYGKCRKKESDSPKVKKTEAITPKKIGFNPVTQPQTPESLSPEINPRKAESPGCQLESGFPQNQPPLFKKTIFVETLFRGLMNLF